VGRRRVEASGRDIRKGRRKLGSMLSRFTRRSETVRILSLFITVTSCSTWFKHSLIGTETKVGGRQGGCIEAQGIEKI
jgi:hypothetical protein